MGITGTNATILKRVLTSPPGPGLSDQAGNGDVCGSDTAGRYSLFVCQDGLLGRSCPDGHNQGIFFTAAARAGKAGGAGEAS